MPRRYVYSRMPPRFQRAAPQRYDARANAAMFVHV